MKTIAMMAAAGSLAAMTAPTQAAEIAPLTTTAPGAAAPIAPGLSLAEDPPHHARAYGRDRGYKRHHRYKERRLTRRDRVWRGRDGQYHCKRGDGTTGLVVGAGVGALLGRTIDTRGDRSLGTLVGAVAGGLLGREIDRGELRCR